MSLSHLWLYNDHNNPKRDEFGQTSSYFVHRGPSSCLACPFPLTRVRHNCLGTASSLRLRVEWKVPQRAPLSCHSSPCWCGQEAPRRGARPHIPEQGLGDRSTSAGTSAPHPAEHSGPSEDLGLPQPLFSAMGLRALSHLPSPSFPIHPAS